MFLEALQRLEISKILQIQHNRKVHNRHMAVLLGYFSSLRCRKKKVINEMRKGSDSLVMEYICHNSCQHTQEVCRICPLNFHNSATKNATYDQF